jgi:hypothetical protein
MSAARLSVSTVEYLDREKKMRFDGVDDGGKNVLHHLAHGAGNTDTPAIPTRVAYATYLAKNHTAKFLELLKAGPDDTGKTPVQYAKNLSDKSLYDIFKNYAPIPECIADIHSAKFQEWFTFGKSVKGEWDNFKKIMPNCKDLPYHEKYQEEYNKVLCDNRITESFKKGLKIDSRKDFPECKDQEIRMFVSYNSKVSGSYGSKEHQVDESQFNKNEAERKKMLDFLLTGNL